MLGKMGKPADGEDFVDSDGTTTRPVGVAKDLRFKTFGITYHVWFVVMDFKNPIDSLT